MKRFEIFDHTADVGIIIYGEDLKSLFENAGEAFFSIITDLENINPCIWRKIEIGKESLECLIVDWLTELLFLHEVEGLLFREFRIESIDDNGLKAEVGGEEFKEGFHVIKTQVKAITYHQIEVKKEDSFWKARIILDL